MYFKVSCEEVCTSYAEKKYKHPYSRVDVYLQNLSDYIASLTDGKQTLTSTNTNINGACNSTRTSLNIIAIYKGF